MHCFQEDLFLDLRHNGSYHFSIQETELFPEQALPQQARLPQGVQVYPKATLGHPHALPGLLQHPAAPWLPFEVRRGSQQQLPGPLTAGEGAAVICLSQNFPGVVV